MAMGLSARERQALRFIESGLRASAPALASRLAVFTRLTAGEAFPARESIRAAVFGSGSRWPLVWPVLWLVISLALIAAALAAGHGGQAACTVHIPCAPHSPGLTPW
jgi:hypothetical protein